MLHPGAFAGQMIATSVLDNVIETEIAGYLSEYLTPLKSFWHK